MGSAPNGEVDMKKFKIMQLIALAGSGLLFQFGCNLGLGDGYLPYAIAGGAVAIGASLLGVI
jgi:hypothetical protein